MQGAAAAVGYHFSVQPNQGQLSQYRQGLASAIATKPSLVDLLAGPDPRVLKPEIDAVKAAGIKVVVSDEISSADPTRKGISSEFDQYGGRHIQYTFANVPIAEWEAGIKPVVKSAIAADPKLTYVICIYDSMSQFIAPAIAEAKAEGKVKLI